MKRLLFVSLFALSCTPGGGGGTGGGSGNLGGGIGSTGGGSGDFGTCGQLSFACGQLGTGGGSASCGECFFTREVLGEQGLENAAAMVNTPNGLVIAWSERGQHWYLSREQSDGGFSREEFAEPGEPLHPAVGLAVADDGTTYITYPGDSLDGVWLATSVPGGLLDGGSFINERVDDGELPNLALDSSGALHLTYLKTANFHPTVWTATRANDGGWDKTLVELVDAGVSETVSQPALLFDSAGDEHLVYRVLGYGPEGGLHHASNGVITTLPAQGPGRTPIAAKFDGANQLHVLWSLSGLDIAHSVRTLTGWVDLGTFTYGAHELGAMTIAPNGLPVFTFHSRSSTELFMWNGHAHARQSIQSCDEGPLALAFDGSNRLRVASGCGSMSVLTPQGYYPADHASRCEELTTQVCTLACGACKASDGDCAISTTTGGNSSTNFCAENFGGRACWDATKTDAMLNDCLAVSSSLTCAATATDGVDLSDGPCHLMFEEP